MYKDYVQVHYMINKSQYLHLNILLYYNITIFFSILLPDIPFQNKIGDNM